MKKVRQLALVVLVIGLLCVTFFSRAAWTRGHGPIWGALRAAGKPQHQFLPLGSKVILAIDFSPSASEVTETIFTCIQETDGLFCRPTIQDP